MTLDQGLQAADPGLQPFQRRPAAQIGDEAGIVHHVRQQQPADAFGQVCPRAGWGLNPWRPAPALPGADSDSAASGHRGAPDPQSMSNAGRVTGT